MAGGGSAQFGKQKPRAVARRSAKGLNNVTLSELLVHFAEDFGMRWVALALVCVVTSSYCLAQDYPRSVKTQKVQAPSLIDTALYAIEADGTVKIDWNVVETLASSKADRTMSPLAEVMPAIRDNRWKPMR